MLELRRIVGDEGEEEDERVGRGQEEEDGERLELSRFVGEEGKEEEGKAWMRKKWQRIEREGFSMSWERKKVEKINVMFL